MEDSKDMTPGGTEGTESRDGIVERSKLSDEISITKNGNKVKIENRD